VHKTLSQKTPSQKKAGGVAQGFEFKPQYHKKKKKKRISELENMTVETLKTKKQRKIKQ
jgi:hypothetical protein